MSIVSIDELRMTRSLGHGDIAAMYMKYRAMPELELQVPVLNALWDYSVRHDIPIHVLEAAWVIAMERYETRKERIDCELAEEQIQKQPEEDTDTVVSLKEFVCTTPMVLKLTNITFVDNEEDPTTSIANNFNVPKLQLDRCWMRDYMPGADDNYCIAAGVRGYCFDYYEVIYNMEELHHTHPEYNIALNENRYVHQEQPLCLDDANDMRASVLYDHRNVEMYPQGMITFPDSWYVVIPHDCLSAVKQKNESIYDELLGQYVYEYLQATLPVTLTTQTPMPDKE